MNRAWYLDSSVLLSRLFRQAGALDPADLAPAFTSALTKVECFRSLDRNRLLGRVSDRESVEGRDYLYRMFRTVRLVGLESAVLDRAAAPISVPLKTLDAIHLTTALQWREDMEEDVTFATHDARLAAAARAHGFPVLGA